METGIGKKTHKDGGLARTLLLFAVIVLEGYVVLATELLAIRQTVPYVGSGTDTVSIVIAAVLMPLAFGYYQGGKFRPHARNGRRVGVRGKLLSNIIISLAILVPGLSYAVMYTFFHVLIDAGFGHRLLLITIYSLTFLVTPVYLLGQTIPLVSNYFSKEKLSRITGRILFFSTMGSFAGALFSTLVLMGTVGVQNTAVFNFILLALLVVLLSKRKFSEGVAFALALAAAGVVLNGPAVMAHYKVVENNKYNTISVYTDGNGARHLITNHTDASKYDDDGNKHEYIQFLERQLIAPLRDGKEEKDILVIGAGAFTFGFEDERNRYQYVDIDESLKGVAEEHVLRRRIKANKAFAAVEARAFLMGTEKKYDIIVLDVYLGGVTIPEHLVTREFMLLVKGHLKEKGVVAANFIMSPNFSNPLTRHMDNTFRSVFPYFSRHVIYEDYMLWTDDTRNIANAIYLYRHSPDEATDEVYTDDRNRIFFDKPQKY